MTGISGQYHPIMYCQFSWCSQKESMSILRLLGSRLGGIPPYGPRKHVAPLLPDLERRQAWIRRHASGVTCAHALRSRFPATARPANQGVPSDSASPRPQRLASSSAFDRSTPSPPPGQSNHHRLLVPPRIAAHRSIYRTTFRSSTPKPSSRYE